MQRYPLYNNFTYHPPFGDQPQRYENMRNEAKNLATHIIAHTPESREQSLALTNLEQVVFWANAAIARNETPADSDGGTSGGERV